MVFKSFDLLSVSSFLRVSHLSIQFERKYPTDIGTGTHLSLVNSYGSEGPVKEETIREILPIVVSDEVKESSWSKVLCNVRVKIEMEG